jgi:hypothetical protein
VIEASLLRVPANCTNQLPPLLPNPRYTLTPGSKFGGDLVAYPGDPSAVHSQFVIRVVPWGARCGGLQGVGRARAARSTRKALLLATAPPAGLTAAGGAAADRVEGGGRLSFGRPLYSTVTEDGRLQPFDPPRVE